MTTTDPTRIAVETPIAANALLDAGYKEYPPTSLDTCERIFQKAVRSGKRRLYFINFREWEHAGQISFDAEMTCETATDGHLWATIKENSIENTERRAALLWSAAGSIEYDKD